MTENTGNAKRPRRSAGPLASIDRWVWRFFYWMLDEPVEAYIVAFVLVIFLVGGWVIW